MGAVKRQVCGAGGEGGAGDGVKRGSTKQKANRVKKGIISLQPQKKKESGGLSKGQVLISLKRFLEANILTGKRSIQETDN